MLDEYVDMCNGLFSSLGVRFTDGELAQLRSVLAEQLADAVAAEEYERAARLRDEIARRHHPLEGSK